MAGILTNQASVSYTYEGFDDTITNCSNIVNTNVRDCFDFTVEKTSTVDCFKIGEQITFFIKITNTGCYCLNNFEIRDNVGTNNLTYVTNSGRMFADGSMISITPTSLNPLTFDISSNLEKEKEIIIQYSAVVDTNMPMEVDSITNEVCVIGSICDCSNNQTRTLTKTAFLTLSKCNYANLVITKTVSSDNVCDGDEFEYIITLTNTGNIDATNVVVTDSLPANFVLTSIYKENNGINYKYDASEYSINEANLLILPNTFGTAINVPSIAPGIDNTTRIKLYGHI